MRDCLGLAARTYGFNEVTNNAGVSAYRVMRIEHRNFDRLNVADQAVGRKRALGAKILAAVPRRSYLGSRQAPSRLQTRGQASRPPGATIGKHRAVGEFEYCICRCPVGEPGIGGITFLTID